MAEFAMAPGGRLVIGAVAFLCCASVAAAVMTSDYDRSPLPPLDPGVCWRADMSATSKPTFTILATDAPNIASCAADVELAYLNDRRPVTGAYQGYYIFSEPAAVSSAERLDFIHYPIFNNAERALIDRRLRGFLQTRASASVDGQSHE
jgi:hypothetical protein